jgi:Protein of unknown function (DUF4244)
MRSKRSDAGITDAGITTVEYAVCISVGVALAGILLSVIRSEAVRAALVGVVLRAIG